MYFYPSEKGVGGIGGMPQSFQAPGSPVLVHLNFLVFCYFWYFGIIWYY